MKLWVYLRDIFSNEWRHHDQDSEGGSAPDISGCTVLNFELVGLCPDPFGVGLNLCVDSGIFRLGALVPEADHAAEAIVAHQRSAAVALARVDATLLETMELFT